MQQALVVGADGAIGAALALAGDMLGTSRRPGSGWLPLDLAAPFDVAALPDANTVFLCAGINGFAACDADPLLAARVNVQATLAIGTHYLLRGAHVIFLSSTAVFDGRADAPDEGAALSPSTTYGAFKSAAELALLVVARNAPGPCSIVRLTKVLSAQTPLLQKWRSAPHIDAFTGSLVCPVSLPFVVQGLLHIAEHRAAGCWHLAGAQTLSYAALAKAMQAQGRLSGATVREISQGSPQSSGVHAPCVSLTMPLTSQKLGIRAQPLLDCLQDL